MIVECRKHPKYRGERRPVADCLPCWVTWFQVNPESDVRAKDLYRILRDIESTLRIHAFLHGQTRPDAMKTYGG